MMMLILVVVVTQQLSVVMTLFDQAYSCSSAWARKCGFVDVVTGSLYADWLIVVACVITSCIVLLILVLLWRRFVFLNNYHYYV